MNTLGLARFSTPFPLALLAVAVAAVGVAVASDNTAHSPALPHRPVQIVAESLHTLAFAFIAALLCVVPAQVVGYASPWAVIRNLAITGTLALISLAAQQRDYLWLAPLTATLGTAMFGSSGPSYTWDILLDVGPTPRATTASIVIFAAVTVLRAIRLGLSTS